MLMINFYDILSKFNAFVYRNTTIYNNNVYVERCEARTIASASRAVPLHRCRQVMVAQRNNTLRHTP